MWQRQGQTNRSVYRMRRFLKMTPGWHHIIMCTKSNITNLEYTLYRNMLRQHRYIAAHTRGMQKYPPSKVIRASLSRHRVTGSAPHGNVSDDGCHLLKLWKNTSRSHWQNLNPTCGRAAHVCSYGKQSFKYTLEFDNAWDMREAMRAARQCIACKSQEGTFSCEQLRWARANYARTVSWLWRNGFW